MRTLISAAAPRTAWNGIPVPHSVAVAILALLASAAILIVFKVLARIFSPRKQQGGTRSSSPYAAPAGKRR